MLLVRVADGGDGMDMGADRVVTVHAGRCDRKQMGRTAGAGGGGNALAALAGTFDHLPEVVRG